MKDQRSKIKIVELLQSGNNLLHFAFCILIFAFLYTGCEQKYGKDDKLETARLETEGDVDVLAYGPNIETISVLSDYAIQATEAAGGDAWTKTKKLQLDCVVTFYQPDGSFYLTEQRYEVYPWSNSIRISAREPQGRLVWQLSKGQFDVLQDDGQIEDLQIAVGRRCFSEVILNIITTPARFLDSSVEFTKQTSAVKVKGQWYYPIIRRCKPDVDSVERLSEAVFYQDRDSSLVDMIRFACMDTEKFLAVRGYDYSEVEKGGLLVPTRIEIFSTDARGDSLERLVKIDCHTVGHMK
ncbi:MAG: hypothetical protein ACYTFW_04400 [Planctomycetota bacterium]